MSRPAGDSLPAGDGTPVADVVIDEALARRLLARQCPEFRDLPLRSVASGFDHVMFRLGDELALRLPRRGLGAGMLPGEQRWLPVLGPHLPVDVPGPVFVGAPEASSESDGYPYPWAVVRWVEGICLEDRPLPVADAEVVDDLLGALRAVPVHDGAPRNPFRGGPLADRHERLLARVAAPSVRRRARDLSVDLDRLRDRFARCLDAPTADAATWAHGDLHPRNVVVRPDEGQPRLAGVVDWSDVTVGDPAVDLIVFWNAFDDTAARRVGAASVDEATWERGIGWAIALGVEKLAIGDDPVLLAIGARCLRNLVAEAAGT